MSLESFATPATWALGYVVVGGFGRFGLGQWDVLQDTTVFIALIVEIVVAGLIGVWLWYRRDSFRRSEDKTERPA